MSSAAPQSRQPASAALMLGALGVVFGDIGTSPLYAFKEAFGGAHALALTPASVVAVLSLVFWSVMLIVSLKYVGIVLRFDNRGEGGILALLAFAGRLLQGRPRTRWLAGLIAVLGASLFFGDAIITPAISVLSAVEGLSVAMPATGRWVVPVAVAVLAALFAVQRRGTGSIGRWFGPVMALWFVTLALLGLRSVLQTPEVLAALDPRHALAFAVNRPQVAFLALGAVFLALTGGEALYADMGHFGVRPIRRAWFALVLPALTLNYLGQGALVLRDPSAVRNPFYLLAPPDLLLPLVALATAATVIASQATISGAFSVTQQASRLGYLPRIPVLYTSDTERGQIYVSRVNWLLLALVLLLVVEFRSSSALAAAYGIAVATTMVLETALVVTVVLMLGRRSAPLVAGLLCVIGAVELLFFASNATKFVDGGWIPLVVALVLFTLLTTWKRATDVIHASEAGSRVPIRGFLEHLTEVPRVPGTAIFFSAESDSVPTTLLHNLKHNKVMHERVLFFRIATEEVPYVPDGERTEVAVLERGRAYQVVLRYGFREEPDIMHALGLLGAHGLRFEIEDTTFFLGKSSIARATRPGLFTWRRELFRWMQKNSATAAEYFRLPPSRVIELGTQIAV